MVTMGVQGCRRWGNKDMGDLVVLVMVTFYVTIDPFIGLITLLVSGQFNNLVLELLDHLEKDFYDS